MTAPDLPPLPKSGSDIGQTLQYNRADMIDYGRACQAPLLAEIERLTNDLADALDLKNGCGPTVLTALVRERDALRAKLEAIRSQALEEAALIVEGEAFPSELARFGVAADSIRGLKRKP